MAAEKETLSVHTNGGSYHEGDVHLHGGDYVNQKVIQNIVLVGHFLELARVEGLLPIEGDFPDYPDIASAFAAVSEKPHGRDLAQATAAAGEILREVLVKYLPGETHRAIPLRTMIEEMGPLIVRRLDQLGYWKDFVDPIAFDADQAGGMLRYEGEVIWLEALSGLWSKHFGQERRFGLAALQVMLAERDRPGFEDAFLGPADKTFLFSEGDSVHLLGPSEPPLASLVMGQRAEVEIRPTEIRLSQREMRVMLVGLLMDLIRLCATAWTSRKLVQDIVDLLAPADST